MFTQVKGYAFGNVQADIEDGEDENDVQGEKNEEIDEMEVEDQPNPILLDIMVTFCLGLCCMYYAYQWLLKLFSLYLSAYFHEINLKSSK